MAEQGDPAAQVNLGIAYAKGNQVSVDKTEAVKWYRKAAEHGYAPGIWNLAFMYIRGEGVNQSDEKARELFQQAADLHFAPAEYDLGMMNLYGMAGKRDRSAALMWIRRAAGQGYKEAIGFLKAQGEYTAEKNKE